MIRLIKPEEVPRLQSFCETTPFGCKIEGLRRAYGLALPFARFWMQEAEQGEITAAVSSLDGIMVLDWRNQADGEELTEFLSAAGCRTLLCEEAAATLLYGKADRQGRILTLCKDRKEEPNSYSGQLRSEVPVRNLFSLLCECGELKQEQFEAFYLDVSHRVRHHAALIQGLEIDGRLIACAMASSITDHAAVLSAVAVHPQFRREGAGSTAVIQLLKRLAPRKVSVFCETKEAERFYASLSFVPSGTWSELDF
ncbi:GNAT family N-acetyltransferase [Clostridium minihomine]|uniref:GNAT family N-acetyltransferase n=1 Tax=Clostridium minihomine TaxID=2045012 RepID=UPI000C791F59|nr:GNAT family N-acetyltransferase [Clostridium minihomine]